MKKRLLSILLILSFILPGLTLAASADIECIGHLTVGGNYEVEISNGGEEYFFTATPAHDGIYVLESSAHLDTYARLFYWDTEEEIEADDDSGYDENFRLRYKLTGGTTYIYGVSFRNPGQTGTIPFSFTEEPIVGTCGDGITWKLYYSTGTLTISGTGKMAEYTSANKVPWYNYRKDIIYVTIGDGVENVCAYAFTECSALTGVIIPETVTSIGSGAFYKCSALKDILLPTSLTDIDSLAFGFCSSLPSMEIPDGIDEIAVNTFQGCTALERVDIPSTVTRIRSQAFYGCDALTDVYFHGTRAKWNAVTVDGNNAPLKAATVHVYDVTWSYNSSTATLTFSGEGLMDVDSPWYIYAEQAKKVVIKSGVEDIGFGAFCGFAYLESVTFADTVTEIGAQAFEGCYRLQSIDIPSSVTFIGGQAFSNCYSLQSVTIPSSVTEIPYGIFTDCHMLKTVVLPNTLTYIGPYAFSRCYSLKNITIPSSVKEIEGYAFYECHGIESVAIPNGVTEICEGTFSHCYALESVTIAPTVKTIGDEAFAHCYSLVYVTIPSGVTTIGDRAYDCCYTLQSVTIPSSVTVIGEGAFDSCSTLTDVNFIGTQKQWKAVTVKADNDPLTSAAIHFITSYEPLSFSGASLTLSSDISVSYYIKKSLVTDNGYTSPGVRFVINGREVTVTQYTEQSGYYIFTFSNITPSEMNDTIKATPFGSIGGGKIYGTPLEYSVVTYCKNQLNKTTDSKFRRLMVDLLNYGAASQTYTNSQSPLANSFLTSTQKGYGTQTVRSYTSVLDPGTAPSGATVKIIGAGLVLNKAIDVNVYFTADSTEGVSIVVKKNGTTVDTITDFTKSGSYFIAKFNKLNPSQLSDAFTFTAYKNGAAASATITYSVETYAQRTIANASSDANLVALVKAMMNYGDSVKAYAG